MPRQPRGLFALSALVLAVMGLVSPGAQALGLGRVTVQSALGEPLRAEIDVPDIDPEEAASLKTSLGSADTYRRAGIEFSPLLGNVQVTLQRRPDGRAYLRLIGDKTVNEPYLDLIVEASWSSGRLVRDYTLLFDPPLARQANAVAPQPAQLALPAPSAPRASALPPVPASGNAVERATTGPTRSTAPAGGTRPAAASAAAGRPTGPASPAPNTGSGVTVRAGDTASKLATTYKPASVSLDQMLVALLQANPEAFVGGNVNRLKAGAVLQVPTADQAAATPALEASQIVTAQSRDFNEFRRRLASGAPATQTAAASRSLSGKLQAHVEDKKPASQSPDKLSLQKGELQAKTAADKLAQELQAREAEKRLAELNRNLSELNKLSPPATAASKAAAQPASPASAVANAASVPGPSVKATLPAATASAPAAPPTEPATAPATPVPPASAPLAEASAPQPAASAPEAPTPPASAASRPPAPALAPAPAEDSLIDTLLDNPLIPAAAGALVALLAGLGFYRVRQRKKAGQVDSSFIESRLQPDSFFGASGGQKIDTSEAALGSSLMYSPSQLDAGADVDPVAEADVYLAYGRDLQAEEILKEALRSSPTRAAIHFKLLQIYGKRRDVKAYAATALEAYQLSGGKGTEWEQACETGRELDPDNPLFQLDGPVPPQLQTAAMPARQTVAAPADPTFAHTDIDLSNASLTAPPAPDTGVDLDLDFSLPDAPEPPAAPVIEPPTSLDELLSEPAPLAAPVLDLNSLPDLELHVEPPPAPEALPPLEMDLGTAAAAPNASLDFETTDAVPLPPSLVAQAPAAPAAPSDPGAMLEFDIDAATLDLLGQPAAASPATHSDPASDAAIPDGLDGDDPLVTKLALAEEFQAIGDEDGARTLAQEVVDGATGSLKAKAQRFLAELG